MYEDCIKNSLKITLTVSLCPCVFISISFFRKLSRLEIKRVQLFSNMWDRDSCKRSLLYSFAVLKAENRVTQMKMVRGRAMSSTMFVLHKPFKVFSLAMIKSCYSIKDIELKFKMRATLGRATRYFVTDFYSRSTLAEIINLFHVSIKAKRSS